MYEVGTYHRYLRTYGYQVGTYITLNQINIAQKLLLFNIY